MAGTSDFASYAVKPGAAGLPVPGFDVRCLAPEAAQGASEAEFFAARGLAGHEHTADAPSAAHDALDHSTHTRLDPRPLIPEAKPGDLGALAVRLPLPPGTLLDIHNAPARLRSGYLSDHPGYFSLGDAGTIDEDGYVSVLTRLDDVINVAGHRLSTGALEAAIAAVPEVAECAVIGPQDGAWVSPLRTAAAAARSCESPAAPTDAHPPASPRASSHPTPPFPQS
jgi:acyl-CoA synthetase (AMP-forming)/AMP-acid ligase II